MMDPVMMSSFLAYGLINSVINLAVRPLGTWLGEKVEGDKKLLEAQSLKDYQHKLDLETLRMTKAYDHQSRQELQRESFLQRIEEARDQYNLSVKKWQDQSFDQRVWPLKTPYDNFSLTFSQINGQHELPIVPCRIFTAKSNKNHDYSRYLENTVNVHLSQFLESGYNLNGTHPVISSIGDWKSDEFQEDAFINALWCGLRGQPVIVLNPVISDNGDTLNIRISFWGLGVDENKPAPDTATILRLDLGQLRGQLIREETRQLLELGMPNVSQELKFNFELLKSEDNVPYEKRDLFVQKNIERYRLASEVANSVNRALSRQVGETMCSFSGLYIDVYHLIEYGTPPIMPEKMLQNSPTYQLSGDFAKFYLGVLTRLTLSNYHGARMKFIYLTTVSSIAKHPNLRDYAPAVLQQGLCLWASEKVEQIDRIDPEGGLEQFIDIIRVGTGFGPEDLHFLQETAHMLKAIGYEDMAAVFESSCEQYLPSGTNEVHSKPKQVTPVPPRHITERKGKKPDYKI